MEQDYIRQAEEESRQRKEKFLHYYERYSNHLNSLQVGSVCVCVCVCTLHPRLGTPLTLATETEEYVSSGWGSLLYCVLCSSTIMQVDFYAYINCSESK